MSARGWVLFCGAWDDGPGYPRTTSLEKGLEAAGVQVRRCRLPGLGASKQRLLRAPWRWPAAWSRQRRQRRELARNVRELLAAQRPRCVVVPYPGHTLVGAVKAACDVPVVLDLFLSAYDTVVEDRALVRPGSLAAHWLRQLDARACAAADLVLVDTPANAVYLAELTRLPAERFAWLPVSDPGARAAPEPLPAPGAGLLQLLFFGTGVPLHGLPTLVDAVAQAPGVQLTLVGGTAAERAHAAAALGARLRLEPCFVPWARLHRLLAESHLVAGVFGGGGKTQRVVPFKVVHALAAGRPVLTAETPAVCAWLDGSAAVFLVPAADVEALARQLRELAAEPARVVAAAAAARATYDRHFSTACTATRWHDVLRRVDATAAAGGA
ncbi:MAG TPA: glycosyltransferase [Planctomycetota bacterium]|nr:glycosyltransferase [Planctomycetota bacterium]